MMDQHAQDQADELESLQSILLPDELELLTDGVEADARAHTPHAELASGSSSTGITSASVYSTGNPSADAPAFRLHVGCDIGGTLCRVSAAVGFVYTATYPHAAPWYTIEGTGDFGGAGDARRSLARLRVLLEEEIARCLGEPMMYDLHCVMQVWARDTAAHLKHHGAQAAVPATCIPAAVLAVFVRQLAEYEPAIAAWVEALVGSLQPSVPAPAGSARAAEDSAASASGENMTGSAALRQLALLDGFQGKTDAVLTVFFPPSTSNVYRFEVERRRGEWHAYDGRVQAVLAAHAEDETMPRQVEVDTEWGLAVVDLSRNTHAAPRSMATKNVRVHVQQCDALQSLAVLEAELARAHHAGAKGSKGNKGKRASFRRSQDLDSPAANARKHVATQRGYALEVLAEVREYTKGLGVAGVADEQGLVVCCGRSKRHGIQLHVVALPPGSKPVAAFGWELGDRFAMGRIKQHWFGKCAHLQRCWPRVQRFPA